MITQVAELRGKSAEDIVRAADKGDILNKGPCRTVISSARLRVEEDNGQWLVDDISTSDEPIWRHS